MKAPNLQIAKLGMGKKSIFFHEIVDYIVDFLGRNSRQIVEKKSKIVDF
jgi:hypothetical protein